MSGRAGPAGDRGRPGASQVGTAFGAASRQSTGMGSTRATHEPVGSVEVQPSKRGGGNGGRRGGYPPAPNGLPRPAARTTIRSMRSATTRLGRPAVTLCRSAALSARKGPGPSGRRRSAGAGGRDPGLPRDASDRGPEVVEDEPGEGRREVGRVIHRWLGVEARAMPRH